MISIFNGLLQRKPRNRRTQLPSPFPLYRIVLKQDAWDNAKRSKGWRTYQDAASSLGLTRAAIQMAVKGRTQVGSGFITRWAACRGNVFGAWWVDFEIIPKCSVPMNHPAWNKEKHNGIIPYEQYSVAAELRNKDYSVEKGNKDD